MKFGLDVSQHQLTFDEILARVRFAEEVGFDGAWVFDHFSPLYGDRGGPCLEAWTLLGALAAHTTRIRLGPLVTGITHRHPSVLTTEIVTVDHVSGGRVECGLGAAWNKAEHRSLGLPFPAAKERMERLEDAIKIFRLLTTGERVSYEGRYYTLDRAQYRPVPVQRPYPPIWIGANGPKLGLPLVGRQADVWHGWGDDEYAGKWEIVRRAAEKAGRDPEEIVRSSSLSISEPWDEVKNSYQRHVANRVSYLIVEWPSEGKQRLDEFVEKVLPRLRSG
jgi:alkanesulfonate monooxygenase SsuD/methylene tetrahydromethanopterin reductase-like flavin-dependent oxidoreductase (luciferase family)